VAVDAVQERFCTPLQNDNVFPKTAYDRLPVDKEFRAVCLFVKITFLLHRFLILQILCLLMLYLANVTVSSYNKIHVSLELPVWIRAQMII
jgi:hypothetical protein